MKIAATIARLLLGLMFLVFGLNDFLLFIPVGQLPPGPAGQFLGLLLSTHFVYGVGLVMVVSGALLLVNRFVPLALTLLGAREYPSLSSLHAAANYRAGCSGDDSLVPRGVSRSLHVLWPLPVARSRLRKA